MLEIVVKCIVPSIARHSTEASPRKHAARKMNFGKLSQAAQHGLTEAHVIEDHKIDTEPNTTVIGSVIRLASSGAAHVCLLTALIVGATDAAATPLNPFRYEAQARRHCPVDTVVWLDFRKGIYYSRQQKRYAQGSTGSFVCREEAQGNGYRRSLLGLR
jgi:hypothetical protein